jgi:hypothetical protein
MTFNSIRGQLSDIFILKSHSFFYGSYGMESLIVMGNKRGGKTCLYIVSQNLQERTEKKHEKVIRMYLSPRF